MTDAPISLLSPDERDLLRRGSSPTKQKLIAHIVEQRLRALEGNPHPLSHTRVRWDVRRDGHLLRAAGLDELGSRALKLCDDAR